MIDDGLSHVGLVVFAIAKVLNFVSLEFALPIVIISSFFTSWFFNTFYYREICF